MLTITRHAMNYLSVVVLMCRSYANAIVDLLDLDHQLFGQRIISQGAAGDGAQQDLTKRLMQVLCYAVLSCAVLCCTVLCCAVLCCAVLCCAAIPEYMCSVQCCDATTVCLLLTFVYHALLDRAWRAESQ